MFPVPEEWGTAAVESGIGTYLLQTVLVPVLLRKYIRAGLFRLHDARKARRNDDTLDFRLGSGRLERVQGALDGRVDQVLVRVGDVEVERRRLCRFHRGD